MNEYVARGLADEVRAGKRVLVLVDRALHARWAMLAVESEIGVGEVGRVVRANGRESIEHRGGGRIEFHTARSSGFLRGRTEDVVFVDCVAGPALTEELDVMALAGARVVRA